MLRVVFLLGLVISHSASIAKASEIDSFTERYNSLSNSSEILDQMATRHLQQALKQANQKGKCSEYRLMSSLREHFQIILFKGKFMQELMNSTAIERRAIPRAESIYKYHTKRDGYLLVRPAADQDGIGMGAMIQYKDLYLGTDKFEHLFGRGYLYYYEHVIRGRSIESVLVQSATDERALLGGMWFETGVFSYADLVANFNGIRFWNDFLKKRPDLLGRELEPVLKCQNGKWVMNRPISFSHYIDEGMDEALNCVQTATHNGANGMLRSLQDLKEKDPEHDYACPLNQEKIPALESKYGRFSPWLFNFKGIQIYQNNFPVIDEVQYWP